MAWRLVIADRAGNALGELRDARARSLRFVLNRTPTATFNVDALHPLGPLLLDDDRILLKAYAPDAVGALVPRLVGPLTAHDKARGRAGGTIGITAAGPQSRLARRLIGKNVAGATFGTDALTLLDRGELMARAVEAVNSGEATNIYADAGDTGIRRGTITASASTYTGPHRYTPVDEVLAALSGTLDSPDWEVAPVEPYVDGIGLVLGLLNVAPIIGTTKPDVVFEYGAGAANVEEWRDTGDAGVLCNRGVSLPPGFPDNATAAPIEVSDAASITSRGLNEAVIPGDLASDLLRTTLVQEHVRIRSVPRRLITFTPIAEDPDEPIATRRVPRPFLDYIVGDVVRFRATETYPRFDTNGTAVGEQAIRTIDALCRVFAITINLDDAGVASTAVTLTIEG